MNRRGKFGSALRATMVVGSVAVALAASSATAAQPKHTSRPARTDTGIRVSPYGDLVTAAEAHAAEEEGAYKEVPSTPARPLAVKSRAASAIGSWAAPKKDTTGVVGIHSVLLRTGKVLMWSGFSKPTGSTYELQTMATVWDPITGKSHRVDPPEDNSVFCGGATILGDGTVLVVGGTDPYHGWYGSKGTPVVLLFNPITEQWTQAPPMVAGRWYPTVTELADGSAVIVGGRDVNAKGNNNLEVVGPMPSTTPRVVGQYKLDFQQDLYPNQFLLPNHQVFTFAGNRTDYLDPSTWRINKGPVPLAAEFNYPNAVVLPITPGGHIQMVVYGGKNKFAGTTTSISSKIDLSATSPTFTALRPMPQPRTNMNSVLLPDGTILVVGGNQVDSFTTPNLQSLLYNPADDTWTPLASQALRRAYHSTAILLPDGRVLSAGDNGPAGGGHNYEEVYSPSYLFKGARPTITQAPTTATVGSTFLVVTDSPVTKAVLISPAATTHATNMHQRMVQLPAVPLFGRGVAATIPNDGTVPPGPYMLFTLNAQNVPSVATWVMVP